MDTKDIERPRQGALAEYAPLSGILILAALMCLCVFLLANEIKRSGTVLVQSAQSETIGEPLALSSPLALPIAPALASSQSYSARAANPRVDRLAFLFSFGCKVFREGRPLKRRQGRAINANTAPMGTGNKLLHANNDMVCGDFLLPKTGLWRMANVVYALHENNITNPKHRQHVGVESRQRAWAEFAFG
jgi:hypothetical protein